MLLECGCESVRPGDPWSRTPPSAWVVESRIWIPRMAGLFLPSIDLSWDATESGVGLFTPRVPPNVLLLSRREEASEVMQC